MAIHQSAEDYLESILILQKRLGQVRSIDIVNELGYSKPSISIAMKKLRESGLDARLLLQVHDELLIESDRDCAKEVLDLLKTEMENAAKLSVPLKVEAAIGENWLECH